MDPKLKKTFLEQRREAERKAKKDNEFEARMRQAMHQHHLRQQWDRVHRMR